MGDEQLAIGSPPSGERAPANAHAKHEPCCKQSPRCARRAPPSGPVLAAWAPAADARRCVHQARLACDPAWALARASARGSFGHLQPFLRRANAQRRNAQISAQSLPRQLAPCRPKYPRCAWLVLKRGLVRQSFQVVAKFFVHRQADGGIARRNGLHKPLGVELFKLA